MCDKNRGLILSMDRPSGSHVHHGYEEINAQLGKLSFRDRMGAALA